MFKKLISLYKKHQEVINYLVVGGIGTVISIASFALFLNILGLETVTSNIISWVITVSILYPLNRYFVFVKHARGFSGVIREIIAFVSARIATLLLETLIVWVGIDVLKFNSDIQSLVIKTFGQILVIVLNYVASKLFIFKNSNGTNGKTDKVSK